MGMTTDLTTLAARTRFARKNAGLTQEDLAKKLGVSQGTITHIESGRNKETIHIIALARLLGVRAEWLATGEGDMFDGWPFKDISKAEFERLPAEAREDIADYIQMKISKNKSQDATATAA